MDNIRKSAATIEKDGDEVIEQVREVAHNALERGRETLRGLTAQGKEAMVGAQKKAEDAWEDAQKLVQKHPGKAVGIALMIGAAVGALLAFRRRD